MSPDSPAYHAVSKVAITRAEKTSWALNSAWLTPAYMVTLVSEIDASSLVRLRERAKEAGRQPPSYTSLAIKAAAITMHRNPEANRAVLGLPFFKRLYQFHNTDIGIAIEKSLPAIPGQAHGESIKNAIGKSLTEISQELQYLAACTEDNNQTYRAFMRILRYVPRPFSTWLLTTPYWFPKMWVQLRGCAAWVNAPSKSGADLVMTTWPWPITFSFGLVKMRPFVVGDEVVARPTMPLVMVFDRRIMGGGPAGRIFAQFAQILETELQSET